MKKIGIPFLLVSLTVFAACGLVGGKEHSNHPDIPGKIVFSAKNDEGTSQIYTMKANGSDLKQLTHTGKHGAETAPAWSFDGRQIIYSSAYMSNTTSQALVVMDANGSHKHLLDKREGPDGITLSLYGNNARWSPDGTQIAYNACPNCELRPNNDIYVYDIATNTHTKLTQSTASDLNPVWSPDGSRIAFTSRRAYVDADSARYRQDLYVMSIDGTGLQRLTENRFVGSIAWTPNGDRIIFATFNGLYQYKFKDDIVSHLQIHITNARPIKWARDGSYLLLAVTNYPKTSFYLFNNQKKLVEKLPFNEREMAGADWFTQSN